jgi:hypothetical protein
MNHSVSLSLYISLYVAISPFIILKRRERTCGAFGGDGNGRQCKIPFTYSGKTYNACTEMDDNQPRCVTSTVNDANGQGDWGYCNCN